MPIKSSNDKRSFYNFYAETGTLEPTPPPVWYGTRGIVAGGYANPGTFTNVIDYTTISSTGNATDFGDLTQARQTTAGMSNSTRGCFGGGGPPTNIIDYITIGSAGNAVDFGDLTNTVQSVAGCSNGSRGIVGGGYNAPANSDVIQYITIANTGNATDFGDLTDTYSSVEGCSSKTRGVFSTFDTPSNSYCNEIDYITVASTGNASDFGNLTQGRSGGGAYSNGTRGAFSGGYKSPGSGSGQYSDVIDYITIASTGNAADFGDLSQARYYPGSLSGDA